MKPVIRYSIIGFLLYVIFMLMLMPADRVYAVLKDRVALPVKLYQIDGTVWKGRVGIVLIKNERLESVKWNFQPYAMVLGSLQAKLGFKKGEGHLDAIVGRRINGNLYIEEVNAQFPANTIEPLFSRIPLGLSGDLVVNLDELEVSPNIISNARGDVRWRNAGLEKPSNIELGSFAMNLEPSEEGIKGVLSSADDSPLQVDGLLVLNPDGTYKLTSTFVIRDPSRADLKQALRFVGNPGPTGKVSMSRSGKLALDKYLPSSIGEK